MILRYARAKLGYFANILMAYGHRRLDVLLAPGIPIVDMYIRTANSCFMDLYQYLAYTRLRHRHLRQY